MIGWVKIHRKLLDSSLWRHPNAARVFLWLLLKARYTSGVEPFNGTDLELAPGTIVYGRKSALAQLPDLTEQKIRTALEYLKATSRITIQSNNKFSIITITNWDAYQADNQLDIQPATSQQPASNQPITTNKNDKKEKKVKNEKNTLTKFGDVIQMNPEDMGKLRELFTTEQIKQQIPKAEEWILRSGKPSAKTYQRPNHNHYLFLKNWLERNIAGAQGQIFAKPDPNANRPKPQIFNPVTEPKPDRSPEEMQRIRAMIADKLPKMRGIP